MLGTCSCVGFIGIGEAAVTPAGVASADGVAESRFFECAINIIDRFPDGRHTMLIVTETLLEVFETCPIKVRMFRVCKCILLSAWGTTGEKPEAWLKWWCCLWHPERSVAAGPAVVGVAAPPWPEKVSVDGDEDR
ncbi:hypothetical protein F5888DRAFT_1638824 [Russula emetica]|nr:hypothetical protein F5888DRAFT_1638824 [Russula emetica]